ncbi:MAG: ABC transporter permease, partial [Verrucomicrobia bacterium]
MLRVLLAKDLRRVWRNPLPALINIALPLCITGLIGLAFGGKGENELEKIKFAVVDEDQSFLSKMLRGAMTQGDGGEHLAPVFVDRATALQKINNNEIGGALIIPTNFTHDYFKGRDGVKLELIKNPAQSIQPAALEELAATAVAILNGLS